MSVSLLLVLIVVSYFPVFIVLLFIFPCLLKKKVIFYQKNLYGILIYNLFLYLYKLKRF